MIPAKNYDVVFITTIRKEKTMFKSYIGFLTLVGITVGLGYWYHFTESWVMGFGFYFCLVILLIVAAGWALGEEKDE